MGLKLDISDLDIPLRLSTEISSHVESLRGISKSEISRFLGPFYHLIW